jgi:predicted site-specific integrase-resolvase
MSKKQENKKLNNLNPYEGRVGLVYARVSSKRQETDGSGLQSQEGRCMDFLKRNSVDYQKSFLDSYSGGGDFMNRPAMKELLAYIDKNIHKKYVVVFDDLARFARDVEEPLQGSRPAERGQIWAILPNGIPAEQEP